MKNSTLHLIHFMKTKRAFRNVVLLTTLSFVLCIHLAEKSFYLLIMLGVEAKSASYVAPYCALAVSILVSLSVIYLALRPIGEKASQFGKCYEEDQELIRTYVSNVGCLFLCRNCGKVYSISHNESLPEPKGV